MALLLCLRMWNFHINNVLYCCQVYSECIPEFYQMNSMHLCPQLFQTATCKILKILYYLLYIVPSSEKHLYKEKRERAFGLVIRNHEITIISTFSLFSLYLYNMYLKASSDCISMNPGVPQITLFIIFFFNKVQHNQLLFDPTGLCITVTV